MDKTTVMAYFSIFGDEFPLDNVTKTLGIEPTKSYKKGDAIKRRPTSTITHCRKETAWEIGTEYEESFDVSIQLNKIVGFLKDKAETISELKKTYNLNCKFTIVIVMENGYTPALYLDTELIDFANKVKAPYDIDLYANPYESEIKD